MKELFEKIFKKIKNEFFTVPNMLSMVRLLIIPLIVWFYIEKRKNLIACLLLMLSSLTDIADGFIARRFDMITDFGKFLDPLADKLTQLSVMACLTAHFKLMLVPLCVLAVKEISALCMRLALFKKTEIVNGARWHGKLSTVLIVSTVLLHLVWDGIDPALSACLIFGVTAFMIFSAVMYAVDCVRTYNYSLNPEEGTLTE